jgi:hypothetical protein
MRSQKMPFPPIESAVTCYRRASLACSTHRPPSIKIDTEARGTFCSAIFSAVRAAAERYSAHMNGTARTILLVLLILLLLGMLPTWGYSAGWGYGPSGGAGVVLVVLVVLLLLGKI